MLNILKWKGRKGGKEAEREVKEREIDGGTKWVRERGRLLKREREKERERERE